jgi:hypothetical protein
MGGRPWRPKHRLQATYRYQVSELVDVMAKVEGEPTTNSNRVTRALGDVL